MSNIYELFTLQHLTYIGVLVTVITASWGLFRLLKTPTHRLLTAMSTKIVAKSGFLELEQKEHAKIFTAVEVIAELARGIQHQLEPNGGTGIFDILKDVQKEVKYLGAFQMSSLFALDQAIFITDKDGLCNYVNRAHSRLTGFRPDECYNDGWINVIYEPERKAVFADWENMVEHATVFDRIMTYVRPGNLNPYKVRVHATKIQNEGEVFGWLGEVSLYKEP